MKICDVQTTGMGQLTVVCRAEQGRAEEAGGCRRRVAGALRTAGGNQSCTVSIVKVPKIPVSSVCVCVESS